MEGRYCCFKCPNEDYSMHLLDDKCPNCGKPYGFPLTDSPSRIGGYVNLEPLGRGFYGATYEAETGALARRTVLKLIPIDVYAYFKKDFMEECKQHQQVAEGTEHLVDIREAFDAEVDFNGDKIRCHIAELDYIPGDDLDTFLENEKNCNARVIAQIARDLFALLAELEKKRKFHNDLHARNIRIQRLPEGSYRALAIEGTIRAVAIDLGSVGDESKSGPDKERLGDLGAVVSHLLSFRERLLANPLETSDADYRLASLLDEIAHILSPDPLSQRTPDFNDIIQQIDGGYHHVSSPWEAPPKFRRFNDSYNAQTLHPWFVNRLLVDPDGHWLASVSTPGPQIITGVRGCGKTMLLRALQFHARVSMEMSTTTGREEIKKQILESLANDGFIGLYVSCTRLLNVLGDPSRSLHEPYTRLYLAYAREALRAVRHLKQIAPDSVPPLYWQNIAKVISDYVYGAGDLNNLSSDLALEREIQDFLVSLDKGETKFSLSANPAIVFPSLAEALRYCSSAFAGISVMFLLDDVSTRHLQQQNIAELLSTLLFSNPICAFKMTTEVQTLEQLLRSPGLIEKARPGRDYDTFDLGAEVNKRLRERSGPEFVASILEQRSKQYPTHPGYTPKVLLGDATLESIARHIAGTDKSSGERKETYHGLRALTALCVGDIGDILSIYEEMLRRYQDTTPPIPARTQSECFMEYCSRRLYHLNRQGGDLKDFALGFAEASHDLLIKSAQQAEQGKRQRLRQYSTIYVRLTTGETDKQFEIIRNLTDKGVFVLEGGSDAPRSKTKDFDPMQQFILTYRKLFGLSSYIGLAESDRFELSGKELEDWLNNPSKGKNILTRNLGGPLPQERKTTEIRKTRELKPKQLPFVMHRQGEKIPSEITTTYTSSLLQRIPKAKAIRARDLSKISTDTVVLGLGFEKRTLASAERILELIKPARAVLIRYPEVGYSKEIERLARKYTKDVLKLDYLESISSNFELADGTVLVDATGLVKPILFKSILNSLQKTHRVTIAHTEAEQHYPLNEDIQPIIEAVINGDEYDVLETAGKIWAGEHKPYYFDKLIVSDADESRRRLLCAAASPKHERLLSLLDERAFDQVDIIVPSDDTPRSRLAMLAADVAIKGMSGSRIEKIDSDDLQGMLQFVANRFIEYYVSSGFNVELALTGSKMHAVACAAACAAFKVAQCWYVRPKSYDISRFTIGVGDTRYFVLEIE